jgi:hypothetical protein
MHACASKWSLKMQPLPNTGQWSVVRWVRHRSRISLQNWKHYGFGLKKTNFLSKKFIIPNEYLPAWWWSHYPVFLVNISRLCTRLLLYIRVLYKYFAFVPKKSCSFDIKKLWLYIHNKRSFFCVFAMHTFASQPCLRRQDISISREYVLVNMYTVQTSPITSLPQYTIYCTIITLLNIPDRLNFEICCSYSYLHI